MTTLSRRGQMKTQATARTALHGGVAGGRGQSMIRKHTAMWATGGDNSDGGGAHGADRKPRRWSDTKDPGGCSDDRPRFRLGSEDGAGHSQNCGGPESSRWPPSPLLGRGKVQPRWSRMNRGSLEWLNGQWSTLESRVGGMQAQESGRRAPQVQGMNTTGRPEMKPHY